MQPTTDIRNAAELAVTPDHDHNHDDGVFSIWDAKILSYLHSLQVQRGRHRGCRVPVLRRDCRGRAAGRERWSAVC